MPRIKGEQAVGAKGFSLTMEVAGHHDALRVLGRYTPYLGTVIHFDLDGYGFDSKHTADAILNKLTVKHAKTGALVVVAYFVDAVWDKPTKDAEESADVH